MFVAWQIALKLVRQGETIDATVGSAHAIQRENPVSVESSYHEEMGEASKEVDMVQTDLLADQSQCTDSQSTDTEVI